MREQTIVNMEEFGRLGNRLFLGAHLLAYAADQGVSLLNLAFGSYAKDFPWLKGNAAFAYPWRETGSLSDAARLRRSAWFQELLPWSARFRYWGEMDWDLDSRGFGGRDGSSAGSQPQRVFVRGWRIRAQRSLADQRGLVLDVFRPHQDVLAQVDESVAAWRDGCDRLVAIHLRWEDYRGTPHFHSADEFRAGMEELVREWPDSRTRFVLFSNENLESLQWPGLDVVVSPGYSTLFDLYAMSRVDQIVAPPSTFSGWASFYGCVPLSSLVRQEAKVIFSPAKAVQG